MDPKQLEADGWVIVGDVANGLWAAFKPGNENGEGSRKVSSTLASPCSARREEQARMTEHRRRTDATDLE